MSKPIASDTSERDVDIDLFASKRRSLAIALASAVAAMVLLYFLSPDAAIGLGCLLIVLLARGFVMARSVKRWLP